MKRRNFGGEIAKTSAAQASLDAAADLRIQMATDAGLALAVLLIATILSTVKPRGETSFDRSA